MDNEAADGYLRSPPPRAEVCGTGAVKGSKASFGRSGGGPENAAGEGSGIAYPRPMNEGIFHISQNCRAKWWYWGGIKERKKEGFHAFRFSSDIHKQRSSINRQREREHLVPSTADALDGVSGWD